MSKVRPVRGTHDLIADEARLHFHIAGTQRDLAQRYGYDEIETPIFEFTEVFARTLGDVSDIVTKEMYTFEDRGGEQLTLRPENTAGVARAVISGGLGQQLPLRFFYHGSMFRYERPQKGRLRQFHQTGIELIGATEPRADVEVIALAKHALDTLGVCDKVELQLNSLGDPESRAAYRALLVDYLGAFRDDLSEDSRARLERNPLRILDSKNERDREIIQDAPPIARAMNESSLAFFDQVKAGLERLGISYTLNPALVRGLDYYTHTTFEFVTTELGAQGAVIAGGRYDGLVKMMGGPDIPGVGWASGVERMAMLVGSAPSKHAPIAIVPIGEEAEYQADILARDLRYHGHAVDLAFKGKPGQRMKRADKVGAVFALSLGDDELKAGNVRVRNLKTGDDHTVALDAIAGWLDGQQG